MIKLQNIESLLRTPAFLELNNFNNLYMFGFDWQKDGRKRFLSFLKKVHIESLMSCHLLLNLLHELANMILCEALPSII